MKFDTKIKGVELVYDIDGDELIIESLIVEKDKRREGLGTKVMNEFMSWATRNKEELRITKVSLYAYPVEDDETTISDLVEFYMTWLDEEECEGMMSAIV